MPVAIYLYMYFTALILIVYIEPALYIFLHLIYLCIYLSHTSLRLMLSVLNATLNKPYLILSYLILSYIILSYLILS